MFHIKIMLTVASLTTEGRQPTQQELEEVRLSAVTLYSRYPGLTYGEHTLESWSEVCKLMELQTMLASESGRPSYSMARQAFWCMRRPYKAEKLWSQLTDVERQVVKTAMVLPVCFDRMGILTGGDAPLPLANDNDTIDSLRRAGISGEWLATLSRWHGHYMANGELKARILADIKGKETTSSLLSLTSTLAGFVRVVISRWARWSTTVCLELGLIADQAVRDNLVSSRTATVDEMIAPVSEQVNPKAQATAYKVYDRGIPATMAYDAVNRLLPVGAFAGLSDVILHPDYSDYQASVVDSANQAWQTVTQHLFYLAKPADDFAARMAAFGYNIPSR